MSAAVFNITGWGHVDVIATFYVAIDAIGGHPLKYGVTWERYNEVEKLLASILQGKGLPADATSFEIESLFGTGDDDSSLDEDIGYVGLKFFDNKVDASGYEKHYGEGSAAKAMQILRESGGEKRRDGYMAKAFCHVEW